MGHGVIGDGINDLTFSPSGFGYVRTINAFVICSSCMKLLPASRKP